jgi:hypothetical protein
VGVSGVLGGVSQGSGGGVEGGQGGKGLGTYDQVMKWGGGAQRWLPRIGAPVALQWVCLHVAAAGQLGDAGQHTHPRSPVNWARAQTSLHRRSHGEALA